MNDDKENEEDTTTTSEISTLDQRPNTQKAQTKRCPICAARWDPFLSNESSFFTYIVCIVVFYFFGLLSIFLLPIVIPSTKTAVTRCSECYEVLEQRDLFSLPSLSDKVLNFRFGNCALVISRKYALVLILVIGALLTIRSINQPPSPPPSNSLKNPEDYSWEGFLKDCGKGVYLSNGVKAKENFKEKYRGKTIEWTGIYMSFSEKDHEILVKMDPTDAIADQPDLSLNLGEYSGHRYKNFAKNLLENEVLTFEGVLSEIGDEYSVHSIRIRKIDKTGQVKRVKDVSTFVAEKPQITGGLRRQDKPPSLN